MQKLLRDFDSAEARVRLAASKNLRDISQKTPEALYPYFDRFAELLSHENNVLKWNAILTVAYLAPADRGGKIEGIIHRYLAPISGPVMITAANTIKGAALIALAKPALAPTIANAIMKTEQANYATPECRNVALGHAISALQSMGGVLGDTRAALRFAARHADNPRPATARKAARWLASSASA
jgi:hypothetical protein